MIASSPPKSSWWVLPLPSDTFSSTGRFVTSSQYQLSIIFSTNAEPLWVHACSFLKPQSQNFPTSLSKHPYSNNLLPWSKQTAFLQPPAFAATWKVCCKDSLYSTHTSVWSSYLSSTTKILTTLFCLNFFFFSLPQFMPFPLNCKHSSKLLFANRNTQFLFLLWRQVIFRWRH